MLGLLLMVASIAAGYWMLTDKRFELAQPDFSGELRYADQNALISAALLELHPNVVTLRTDVVRRAMLANPAIEDASVSVALPNRVSINVAERTPVFVLQHLDTTVLVDANGLILAAVDPATAGQLGLPLVKDLRATPIEADQPGTTLDPIDLSAILSLGAVTPAMLGSDQASLELSLNEDDGFVMTAQPAGWRAIFGNYTPNLRPTDIIPRQVQCLRSLLGSAEDKVQTIYLAPLDERCGTYEPLGTPTQAPRISPTPRPAR